VPDDHVNKKNQGGATALVVHQVDPASQTSKPLLCLDSVQCLLHLTVASVSPADRTVAPTPPQHLPAALLGVSGEGGLFVLDFTRWRPEATASRGMSRELMSAYAADVQQTHTGAARQKATMDAFRDKFFALHLSLPATPQPHAITAVRAPLLVTCALWMPGAWCAALGAWCWERAEAGRAPRNLAPGMSSGCDSCPGGAWKSSWLLVVATEERSIWVLQTQHGAAERVSAHVGDGDTAMGDVPEDSRTGLVQVGMVTCGIVATHMVALGNGRLLISGDDGDSKVVWLQHCPDGAQGGADMGSGDRADAWLLEEEVSVPQFGAAADFAVVSHGAECAGEDLDLVVCSGLGAQASLYSKSAYSRSLLPL
jgi:hypothetical protein